ncbi:MAG: hypothetical protein PHD95_03775 [Candidatus ainarchaeum sp.]|nr:hypothetical protein [Candidatus ainarchaeum sp.]
MIQDDFIFRLFFGSLLAMALSIVFFAVCIFLAGKITSEKENTPQNAIQVALIAFLIGIAIKMLSFVDTIFLVALQFFAALFAIKYFYKNNYSNAAILLVIALIIFIILEWLTAPWIIGF